MIIKKYKIGCFFVGYCNLIEKRPDGVSARELSISCLDEMEGGADEYCNMTEGDPLPNEYSKYRLERVKY